mmetsp:Transcript_33432/g.40419  ORF Transcript_33432/g.40419 Transcript_33432/m.40419 type:complete len:207 (+) Transcript_33432:436-1056(+)
MEQWTYQTIPALVATHEACPSKIHQSNLYMACTHSGINHRSSSVVVVVITVRVLEDIPKSSTIGCCALHVQPEGLRGGALSGGGPLEGGRCVRHGGRDGPHLSSRTAGPGSGCGSHWSSQRGWSRVVERTSELPEVTEQVQRLRGGLLTRGWSLHLSACSCTFGPGMCAAHSDTPRGTRGPELASGGASNSTAVDGAAIAREIGVD